MNEVRKKESSYIFGDYVLTPCNNVFNKGISWWMSKEGYMFAVYCFSDYGWEDLSDLSVIKEKFEEYIPLFDEMVKRR